MLKTKEIRWFFKNEHKHIQAWFDSQEVNSLDKREDIYLNLKNSSIGIKLRNGNIEIKQCVENRSKGCLTPKVWGCFEKYLKWSFPSYENSLLYSAISQGAFEEWITVKKQRYVLNIGELNGKIQFLPIQHRLKSGCQVEFTQLEVHKEQWFTFGIEWFGASYIEINPDIFTTILGDKELHLKDSKSYMAFLLECKPN